MFHIYEEEKAKLANLLAFLRGSVADQMVEAQRKSLNEGNILIVNGFSEEFIGLKISNSCGIIPSVSLGGHEVFSLFSQGGGQPSCQGGTEVDHDAADLLDGAEGQPALLQAHFCKEGVSW